MAWWKPKRVAICATVYPARWNATVVHQLRAEVAVVLQLGSARRVSEKLICIGVHYR